MDRIKESWEKLSKHERISLILGAVCTLVMLCLLLSARGAVETVLPYVLIVGIVEFIAGGVFLWRHDRTRALFIGIGGPVVCIAVLIMMAMGRI